MRRIRWGILITFTLLMMTFAGQVEATDGLRGNECRVESEEVISEDFYFFCNTLVIEGYVNGDVVGIASEVTIGRTGRVAGSVWVLGGNLTVEGVVNNDLHFAGVDLDITGLARFPDKSTDVVALALSLEVGQNVVIPNDVVYYGYQAILNGKVNGDVDFQGQALILEGAIAGDVNANIGDEEASAPLSSLPILYSVNFRSPGLRFGEAGYIHGDLNYEAPQRASARNNVGGSVSYTQPAAQTSLPDIERPQTFWQVMGNYLLETARDVTALILVGIFILNFFPFAIKEPGYRVQTKPISAFSWGLILTFLSIPTALFIVLLSLILVLLVFIITFNELTIMVSVALLVVNLSFLGGLFFLVIFFGRVVTCFVIGFLLLRQLQKLWMQYRTPPKAMGELWMAIVCGVTVFSLVVNLPLGAVFGYFQLFVTGVAAWAGFGAMFIYLRDLWYHGEQRRTLVPSKSGGIMIRSVPPPPDDMDDDFEMPLGMDNLPAGFRGFED